jgi:hypothetical protein
MSDLDLEAIEARAADWSIDSGVLRNDIDALCAELRRLRGAPEDDHGWYDLLKERDDLRVDLRLLHALLDHNQAERDALRAELAEAQKRIDGYSHACEEAIADLATARGLLSVAHEEFIGIGLCWKSEDVAIRQMAISAQKTSTSIAAFLARTEVAGLCECGATSDVPHKMSCVHSGAKGVRIEVTKP